MSLLTLLCSGWCVFNWMREDYRYARPFGISDAESLMNVSERGVLQCNCSPTDALEIFNDRRRSCRECGCAIVAVDPARLYQTLSREEIKQITLDLRKLGIQAGRAAAAAKLVGEPSLVEANQLVR